MRVVVTVVLLAGLTVSVRGEDARIDPPGRIDPANARLKRGGFWDGYWTRFPAKLTDGPDGSGVNREHNATFRALASVAGRDDPRAFEKKGWLHFRIRINAAGLNAEGGGKHLVNVTSMPGALGRRDQRGRVTRIEIANPGGRRDDPHPRLVLHNYDMVDGKSRGGAVDLGGLPWKFEPDRWVEVDWSWELDGRRLRLEVNGRKYEADLLDGSEGPGLYWGPGHMETVAGGGEFTFADVRVAEAPPAKRSAP